MPAPHRPLLAVLAVLAALALSACGQSKSDKAMKSVCNARADISKQVDHLSGLTVSTATLSDVQKSVQAIGKDLKQITGAQGDLNADRRKQIQDANKAFASQVETVVSNVGKDLSLSNAQAQLTSAAKQLADTYKQTLGRVSC